MAIRRCPYCKAIIDESQKYCNNCGTQLLFPEDETAEEDVKGEKIVDEDFKDVEDEDEKLDEPLDGPADEATRHEIDLEDVIDGGSAFPDEPAGQGDEDEVDEESDEDMDKQEDEDENVEEEPLPPPPPPKRGRPNKAAPAIPPPPPPVPTKAPTRRPTSILKPPTHSFTPIPTLTRPPEPSEPATPLPPIVPPTDSLSRPIKRDTRDFAPPSADKAPKSRAVEAVPGYGPGSVDEPEPEEPDDAADRGEEADTKEEIARLISALEKKHHMARVPDTASKVIAPLDAASGLPPWSDLGSDTAAPDDVEPESEEKADASSFVPGDTMDFQDEVMRRSTTPAPAKPTIGMPEPPVKPRTTISFEGYEPAPVEAPAEAPVIRRKTRDFKVEAGGESPAQDKPRETRLLSRRWQGFLRRIAATIFDLVFVALFWAAAVGLAAMLMGADAAGLVRASALPLALLYGVLFAGYMFLFFFFLGETLGGRLMSRRESA